MQSTQLVADINKEEGINEIETSTGDCKNACGRAEMSQTTRSREASRIELTIFRWSESRASMVKAVKFDRYYQLHKFQCYEICS